MQMIWIRLVLVQKVFRLRVRMLIQTLTVLLKVLVKTQVSMVSVCLSEMPVTLN